MPSKSITPSSEQEEEPPELSWVRYLPEVDRHLFADELALALRASQTDFDQAAVETLVRQWRNTSEVWADPDLRRRLTD